MKIHCLFWAMLGALSLCLYGCNNDDTLTNLNTDDHREAVTAYFTVAAKNVPSFAQSRWVPTTENAVNHEGDIHDVLVVIYGKSLNDASLTDTDKPLQMVRLNVTYSGTNTSAGEKIYSIPEFPLDPAKVCLEGEETEHTYYVLVVANPDATLLGSSFKDNADLTLSQLRDYDYTGPIFTASASSAEQPSNVGDVSGFDRFLMVSDIEGSFTLTKSVVDSKGSVDISGGSPILVERLAARIDVSFGKCIVYNGSAIETEGTEYYSGATRLTAAQVGDPSYPVTKVVLPVYDYSAYVANPSTLIRLYDTYEITDVDVSNAVNNAQRLIQSNSTGYFKGETWVSKTGTEEYNGNIVSYDGYYCDKLTASCNDSYSYISDQNHSLSTLILQGNKLYTDPTTSVPYYTLGYYRENVKNNNKTTYDAAVSGRTKVTITGKYYKASDLDSKGTEIDYNMDFVIRHCHLTGSGMPRYEASMAYAVGRNTIYRLRIDKVLADSERVYVIWYYDADNDGTYNVYDPTTDFYKYIVDKNDEPQD